MPSSLAVILMNWRRPQNIGRIARGARAALPDAPIFIIDNSERPDLAGRDDVPWGEVWLQRRAANHGAAARFDLAARAPFDRYLALDDDVFLSPAQITALVQRLEREPDRAHGLAGQRVEFAGGQFSRRAGFYRVNAALSVLNIVYAFSREQAVASLALAARVGITDWRDMGPTEDIFLSCGSAKPPLCHDLGPIDMCPTADTPGVAQWRDDDFGSRRTEVFSRLLAIQAVAVFSPAP